MQDWDIRCLAKQSIRVKANTEHEHHHSFLLTLSDSFGLRVKQELSKLGTVSSADNVNFNLFCF